MLCGPRRFWIWSIFRCHKQLNTEISCVRIRTINRLALVSVCPEILSVHDSKVFLHKIVITVATTAMPDEQHTMLFKEIMLKQGHISKMFVELL